MEIIIKICILITFCLLGLFLGGCFNPKPKPPEPEPEPEPIPDWKEHYPKGCYIGITTIPDLRWQAREYNTPQWEMYENKIKEFMTIQNRQDYNALSLAKVLTVKINNDYYFKWTSDMEVWQKDDYWATPYQFVIVKEGRGDCEDHVALHCDYLFDMSQYWLVNWLEIYWKQKKGSIWKTLGHAVTIFKEFPDSKWRCFSNQQFLGMTNGYDSIGEIVSKFCPRDDNHKLIKVIARHPTEGFMLWLVDTNHGMDDMWLTLTQLKQTRKEV